MSHGIPQDTLPCQQERFWLQEFVLLVNVVMPPLFWACYLSTLNFLTLFNPLLSFTIFLVAYN